MNTKNSKSPVYNNMGWQGDGSDRGQGCQGWTAVGLPPWYPSHAFWSELIVLDEEEASNASSITDEYWDSNNDFGHLFTLDVFSPDVCTADVHYYSP